MFYQGTQHHFHSWVVIMQNLLKLLMIENPIAVVRHQWSCSSNLKLPTISPQIQECIRDFFHREKQKLEK
ncbi:Uncharacterized protein TCM_016138 [Theobroma cacao]|uniref:Uncharacterized protein n=1 Tax=Theobroma cacao TaxID=3641 RepID=A0A061G5U0_THECC|nr:Uncharacterized protein TCM_016138 [Theobroma cacao]